MIGAKSREILFQRAYKDAGDAPVSCHYCNKSLGTLNTVAIDRYYEHVIHTSGPYYRLIGCKARPNAVAEIAEDSK